MLNWVKENHGKMLVNKEGENLFVFDWSALTDEQQSYLGEYQMMNLVQRLSSEGKTPGEVFDKEIIPFALVSVEEDLEPEEILNFFDPQCNGVLFLKDNDLLHCDSSPELSAYSKTPQDLMAEFSEGQ